MSVAPGTPRRSVRPTLIAAEVLFLGVNLATATSLVRVFTGGDWLPILLAQLVAGHLVMAGLRRIGAGSLVAAAAGTAMAVTALVWVHAPDLTAFGVPTVAALEHLGTLVGDAFASIEDVKAPTEALDGFVILATAGLWLSVVGGDGAAFRSGATFEALAPATTVFTVVAVFASDAHRAPVTALWLAAVLGFVLARRADQVVGSGSWIERRRHRGSTTLVRLGVVLGLGALGAAVLVAPRLPGASAEGLVDLTDLADEQGSRVTLSPFVDIRGRLVDQSDAEVFTVRADQRSYWRLTSLDRFDGSIWASSGSYGTASGELAEGLPVASERTALTQEFTIAALSQIWLPAAYEPRAIDATRSVRYDETSGTLIVDADQATSDGLTYSVESAVPRHDPDALATASEDVPGDIGDRYLGLPDDFSPRVAALAAEITEGSSSTYEAARRLQDHFRANFGYDLGVRAGHGTDAMETFLFELGRGYCEQFAGAYAAMMRSVGVPARVAVGFTPGDEDPEEAGLFHVRGEHAHAWPEVYLGEFGWVPFEPTPGRGSPQAVSHTGVPEQQAAAGDPTTATTAPAPIDPSTPVAAGATDPLAELEAELEQLTGGPANLGEPRPEPSTVPGWLAGVAATAAVLVAAYVLVVLGVPALGRRNRRRAAVTATQQVALAWDEATRAIERLGVRLPASHSQTRLAGEVAVAAPALGAPVRELADTVQQVTFGPAEPSPTTGDRAMVVADTIRDRVHQQLGPLLRLRTSLDPRRLRY